MLSTRSSHCSVVCRKPCSLHESHLQPNTRFMLNGLRAVHTSTVWKQVFLKTLNRFRYPERRDHAWCNNQIWTYFCIVCAMLYRQANVTIMPSISGLVSSPFGHSSSLRNIVFDQMNRMLTHIIEVMHRTYWFIRKMIWRWAEQAILEFTLKDIHLDLTEDIINHRGSKIGHPWIQFGLQACK